MSSKDIKYKVASPKEFEELVSFVLSLPGTERKNNYKVNEAKVVLNLCNWITKHPTFLATLDEDIVGCYVLSEEEPLWWSTEKSLTNPIVYVKPEYRSTKIYDNLRSLAEEYAEDKGLLFTPSLVFVDRLETKEKLFERDGYEKVGSYFKKEFSHG